MGFVLCGSENFIEILGPKESTKQFVASRKWIQMGSRRRLAGSRKSCNPDFVYSRNCPLINILFPAHLPAHSHAPVKYAAVFGRNAGERLSLLSAHVDAVPANQLTMPAHIF